jgi:hypothetical protein
MPLVEVPRRSYCREKVVAQDNGSVGVALYGNTLGMFQYIAGKHSSAHLIDHRIVAKGLALFDQR